MTQGSDFNQRPGNDGMNKYDDMMLFVRICIIVILIATLLRVYGRIILQCARFIRRSRQRSGFMQHQFYFTGEEPTTLRNVGLDSAILETLPKFVYRSQIGTDGLECAVCLCEWEENEKGRLLPNCGHSFHVECIDMWFLWDSTCPLCRTAAQPEHPAFESARIGQVSATIPTPIASGLDPNLNSEQGQTASSEEEYDPQYSPPNTLSSCGQDEMNVDMDEGTSGGGALMPHIAIDIPKRPHVFWSPAEGHMPNDSQSSSKAPVSDLSSLTNQFTRDIERKIPPSDHPGERYLEHDGAAQSQ